MVRPEFVLESAKKKPAAVICQWEITQALAAGNAAQDKEDD
jgi:hypothetical protein